MLNCRAEVKECLDEDRRERQRQRNSVSEYAAQQSHRASRGGRGGHEFRHR